MSGSNLVKARTQSLGSRKNTGAIHSGRNVKPGARKGGTFGSKRTTNPHSGTGAIKSGKGGMSVNPMRAAIGKGGRAKGNDNDADDY